MQYALNLWWIGLHLYHVDMQIFAKIVSLKLRESGLMKENAQVAERNTLLDNASTLICDFYLASGYNYQLVILIIKVMILIDTFLAKIKPHVLEYSFQSTSTTFVMNSKRSVFSHSFQN